MTEFEIAGKHIRLEGGKLTDKTGRLAGAHLAMDTCVRNMVENEVVPLEKALQMASGNPARALGLGDELGKIEVGFRASLTLLSDDLRVGGVVVDCTHF